MAAKAGKLQLAGVRLDPNYSFHFYGLDCCRSAEAADCESGLGRLRSPMSVAVRRSSRRLGRRAWSDTSLSGAIEPNVSRSPRDRPSWLVPLFAPTITLTPSPSSPSPR